MHFRRRRRFKETALARAICLEEVNEVALSPAAAHPVYLLECGVQLRPDVGVFVLGAASRLTLGV